MTHLSTLVVRKRFEPTAGILSTCIISIVNHRAPHPASLLLQSLFRFRGQSGGTQVHKQQQETALGFAPCSSRQGYKGYLFQCLLRAANFREVQSLRHFCAAGELEGLLRHVSQYLSEQHRALNLPAVLSGYDCTSAPQDCVLILGQVLYGKRPSGAQQCCAYSQTVILPVRVWPNWTVCVNNHPHKTINTCICLADDAHVQTLDL